MPETIGRYQIKEQLGRGGMATVYHAYDPRFKRDVAIKVLPAEFLHESTFRERFEREAQTIAALEHSAIVPVYDYGEESGQPFLVMRYMPGGSLADRIKRGPLPISEATAILTRIATALHSAHNQGTIHRDIKPANILFDAHGDAYLADFGIVKLTESTAQLTGSGIVGTPSYMAPEMAEPGGMSPLIDIYALGVTLYQMLTGKLPYEADTPVGVLMAHATRPVPDPCELRPDLPPAARTIVQRAMAKDPAQRYQTALEMAESFQAAAQEPAVSQVDELGPTGTLPQPVRPEEPIGTLPIAEEVMRPPTPRPPEPAPPPTPLPPEPAPPPKRGGFPAWALILIGVGVLACIGVLAVGGGIALISGQPSTPTRTPPLPQKATATSKPTLPPATTSAPSTPAPISTDTIAPVEINPYCEFFDESPVYVEKGTPVRLVWAWAASSADLLDDHIAAAHYQIYLDGELVEADGFRDVYTTDDGWPAVGWWADVGVLSEGSHLAERYLSWSTMISDGWDTFGPGGDFETEYDTCTIIVR